VENNSDKKIDKSLFAASKIIERTIKKDEHLNFHHNNDNNIKLKIVDSNEINNKNENITQHTFNPTSNITPYILLIALSLHGLFEGIALGVMKTIRDLLFLLIAILAHKWAESLALGISFFKSGTERNIFIKMIVIFSLFSPSGIIIGILFSSAGYLIEGILLSVSGGTFLYVSASEVIVEEFAITKYKYKKYAFYLLGGILVGILKWYE
jgi:zinc transporter 1/2/3